MRTPSVPNAHRVEQPPRRSRLAELASPELTTPRRVLAVPLGSCEQHGPHLPLGTDTLIAIELAQRLAARRSDVVVAPALAVAASGEHAGFPGTLSIGTATTAAVLVELARSADWAAGIVLVNGHGGNADAVTAAVATIRAEGGGVVSWSPRIPGADAHAGRTETSLMLAIDAGLVAMDLAVPGEMRPLQEIAAHLRRGGVRAVSRSGVLGDPTGATLEEGRNLLDKLTDDLVTAVDDARTTW
jgi:mycofactocin system creatininase family protein